MKTSTNAAFAAIALSCLSFAQPVAAESARRTVTVRVSHAGLNLANPAHRDRFQIRVARAARFACRQPDGSLAMRRDSVRCVAEMQRDADRQLAMLISPRAVEVAGR